MQLKPNLLLLAALVAMAIPAAWHVSSKDPPDADAVGRQNHAHRDRSAGERKGSVSAATMATPAAGLSRDDLLAIYHRRGAAAALAAAKSQPWPTRDGAVYFILTHIATEDPGFAAAELKSSGLPSHTKSSLVDTILENWNDARKALDWAENQLTGVLRGKAVAGALGILVKSDPDAAFGYLEKMPASVARSEAIPAFFAAWGSHDPATAMRKANELPQEEARLATEHVVRGWAKTDPASAAAWVMENAPTDERWIAGVFQSWISVSRDEAQLWFDSLPEGDAKNHAATLTFGSSGTISMPVFFTLTMPTDHTWSTKPVAERSDRDLIHWAIQDTEDARAFVEQNPGHPASGQLGPQVARAISGKHGTSEAIEWLLGLPEDYEARDRALGFVFREWSDRDPTAASVKLESMPPDQYGRLPLNLVHTWVAQDPAAAAEWVAGWSGDEQTGMIENVIARWTNHDPHAAYQWLGELPPVPDAMPVSGT